MQWQEFAYQAAMMSLAFVQSAVVGLERQARHKAAGFRTHILVGVASCLFTLISIYGFSINPSGRWDGSRIAAQIVSGIGFLGAGVIFINRDMVRGLTTAASVWLVAAIGMACGAGMPQLGAVALVLHVITIFLAPPISRILPNLAEHHTLNIEYLSGQGTLRHIMEVFEQRKKPFRVQSIRRIPGNQRILLALDLEGWTPTSHLVEEITTLDGVVSVATEADSD